MTTMLSNLRTAARRLLRTRTFFLATTLTLTLAIGANVVIFAVVQRVVINPLPYPDSDRLIELDHQANGVRGASNTSMPISLYSYYERQSRTLDSLAVYRRDELTLDSPGGPERVAVVRVTAHFFSTLGISPTRGRSFRAEETVSGGPQVILISNGLWIRKFAGDAGIIGRAITLEGVPREIIGVLPASFAFPDARVDIWMPELLSPIPDFDAFAYTGVARMRAGTDVQAVRTELTNLISRLPDAYPGNPGAAAIVTRLQLRSVAVSLKQATIGAVANTLWVLLAAAGLAMLVARATSTN